MSSCPQLNYNHISYPIGSLPYTEAKCVVNAEPLEFSSPSVFTSRSGSLEERCACFVLFTCNLFKALGDNLCLLDKAQDVPGKPASDWRWSAVQGPRQGEAGE